MSFENIAEDVQCFAKVAKFRQIWSHWWQATSLLSKRTKLPMSHNRYKIAQHRVQYFMSILQKKSSAFDLANVRTYLAIIVTNKKLIFQKSRLQEISKISFERNKFSEKICSAKIVRCSVVWTHSISLSLPPSLFNSYTQKSTRKEAPTQQALCTHLAKL